MNFADDPSKTKYHKIKIPQDRIKNSIFKELSKTSCYTSIITGGLWRSFGNHIAFNDSINILEKMILLGINHFDLGNNYGRPVGTAEVCFGRALRSISDYRDELLISSKAGYEMLPGPNGSGSSLKHLRSQIEGSLKRIGIEYLDIFYTHRYDPKCEIEYVADNIKYLHEKQLFLYAGISSYPKDKLISLIELLNERKVPIAALQYNISLLSYDNFELCKYCFENYGISTIAFSPLNQGILSESFYNKTKETNSRTNEDKSTVFQMTEEIKNSLDKIKEIANKNKINIETLAAAWLLSNPFVCSIACGPRTTKQIFIMKELKKTITDLNINLTTNDLKQLSVPCLNQWKIRDPKSAYDIIF